MPRAISMGQARKAYNGLDSNPNKAQLNKERTAHLTYIG